jgi:hypothetical protein
MEGFVSSMSKSKEKGYISRNSAVTTHQTVSSKAGRTYLGRDLIGRSHRQLMLDKCLKVINKRKETA